MVGADEGEGRLPWAEFGWWGGKIPAACCGWGGLCPPTHTHIHSRMQKQEVCLRQSLHFCRRQAADPPPAPDLSEASLDADSRQESPGLPAEGPTSGTLRGGVGSQENRSPWVKFSETDAVSLGWDKPGSHHPKSQDSGSSLPILPLIPFCGGAGATRDKK